MKYLVPAIGLVALLTAPGVHASSQADAAWQDYVGGRHKAAVTKLTELAYAGDADAAYYLGSAYKDGLGVKRDGKMAAWWIEKAANKGHKEAAFVLGFLYLHGVGEDGNQVAADPKIAAQWLTAAADAGNAEAQAALSRLYAEGQGVDKDSTKALALAESAAKRGHPSAQFDLGMAKAKVQDARAWIDAYAWFSLAAAKNYPGAAENLAKLEKHLHPQEIEQAKKRAAELKGG